MVESADTRRPNNKSEFKQHRQQRKEERPLKSDFIFNSEELGTMSRKT